MDGRMDGQMDGQVQLKLNGGKLFHLQEDPILWMRIELVQPILQKAMVQPLVQQPLVLTGFIEAQNFFLGMAMV